MTMNGRENEALLPPHHVRKEGKEEEKEEKRKNIRRQIKF